MTDKSEEVDALSEALKNPLGYISPSSTGSEDVWRREQARRAARAEVAPLIDDARRSANQTAQDLSSFGTHRTFGFGHHH
ncbi:MAG: hypothetical protein WAV25_00550 [Minisyncoccia bacterium]